MASRIDGDLVVSGDLAAGTMTLASACVGDDQIKAAGIGRAKLTQDDLKPYPVNLTDFRMHDSITTVLPGTAANDDLGITGGTFGTNPVYLTTGDVKNGNSARYARALIPLPAEYVDGETVTLRVTCGMQTTVAGTSCTIDCVAYEVTGASATGISADLCATAAQDMNSLTAAAKDFTITPTALAAGDVLDVRLAITYVDAVNGTAVIGNIYKVTLLCDVKG
jgi:hypothetical protein